MNEISTIKWLKIHSKKQNYKIWILAAANILFALISVAFSFAIKFVIDGAVEGKTNKILYGAIALVVFVVCQFCLRLLINILSEHVRNRLEVEYKAYIYDQILQKDYKEIKKYHSGELMNRITNDVSVVCSGYTEILPSLVAAVSRLVFAVIALILLDWIFAVAFSVAGILVFVVISLLRAKLKNLHKNVQETDGKTRSFMQESIENLLAIKVFSANKKVEEKSDELQEKNYKVKMKRAKFSFFGHATYNFIFSAGYLFALIYGAVKIFNGVMAYGSLSAILQLVNNVQVPFASISEAVPKYISMVASAERLREIEDLKNDTSVRIEPKKLYNEFKSIVVDNVTFSYGRDDILAGANFKIEKGDRVMIEGRSGIGKSTLIKLLLGVYPVKEGKIFIQKVKEAQDIDGTTRSLFSYVPQGNLIFSGTLHDNLCFTSSQYTSEEIERALKISCADEFIKDLPEGLNTVIGEKGIGLSEGQVQRLAIARALLVDAPILLLDESTSALDQDTELKVLNNLQELKEKTIVIVSHKKAAANICNRRIKISGGKFVESTAKTSGE